VSGNGKIEGYRYSYPSGLLRYRSKDAGVS
jgi:hypothetical protein